MDILFAKGKAGIPVRFWSYWQVQSEAEQKRAVKRGYVVVTWETPFLWEA